MGIRDKVRTYFEPEGDLLEEVVTEEGESPEDQAKFFFDSYLFSRFKSF